MSDDSRDAILDRRARRMARSQNGNGAAAADEILVDLAIVKVADREIGLPTASVREILPRPEITPLPTADARLAGLAQVRGRILAVAELSALLGEDAGERRRTDAGHLALVDTSSGPLGLLVDDVGGFRRLRRGELTEEFRLGEGASPIQGITRDLMLILDVDQLLPAVGRNAGAGNGSRNGDRGGDAP